MNRRFGLATAFTATAALSVGCGIGESAKTLDVIPANNTIEQVTHNPGSAEALGALGLKQQLHTTVTDALGPQTLNLYNYTNSLVDPQSFQRIVDLYEKNLGNIQTYNFTISPHAAREKVPIQADTMPNLDKEHDFVLVPNNTAMPPLFKGNYAQAITTDLKARGLNADQTISFVEQPTSNTGQPEAFFASSGLTTEMCQALIVAAPEPPADVLTNRLAQEAVCNSIGDAAMHAMHGDDYATYSKAMEYAEGTISVPMGGTYVVQEFTLPETTYGTAQQALDQ
ncbi:MAG TPA: hypothetical protein VJR27_02620 [Candidatus Saccharimonadales bacterium]|nr:hypothetical protein [Candidatus Saccharimonadales bacterium]